MSYPSVKRLTMSLQQLISRYEQQFGEIPTQPGRREEVVNQLTIRPGRSSKPGTRARTDVVHVVADACVRSSARVNDDAGPSFSLMHRFGAAPIATQASPLQVRA